MDAVEIVDCHDMKSRTDHTVMADACYTFGHITSPRTIHTYSVI